MPLKFGFSIRGVEPITRMAELAQRAEEAGFDQIWTADSHAIFRELYVTLTAMALRTRRMNLGPIATSNRTRHPTVTAAAMAALDEVSGGRALLGFSVGGSANRAIGARQSRVKECEESIGLIRKFWRGEPVTTANPPFRFPCRQIPIYFTGSGSRVLTMAARVADGVIISATAFPLAVRKKVEMVRKASREAGRGPTELKVGCEVNCCVSEDSQMAKHIVKPLIVHLGVIQPELFQLAGIDIDMNQFRKAHASQDDLMHSNHWENAIEASDFVTDEMVEKFFVAGTAAECFSKVKALAAEDLDHVIIRPFLSSQDPSRLEFDQSYIIDSFGREIIPRLVG